ncbi:MAG: CDP-diacylglycerol--glycerol-3-phosphate 3-phosphatidyltransferase [uncultured Solirubrobacterales bacterium]|uniref:CDP-diacylglycerol--glycerol-3-phosphate 3-phosphatidyltransferase n=1 Tax=uncultured Solirubrobacterales bacterium TaxID=768556 RepID=A0A6J4S964_9ACTN|nr:MAG: CDP-diacylglycerol--glycerol-3-phosphate 3-phosphatidyltransferase [uncultured Solirubrobacterales bacterium]
MRSLNLPNAITLARVALVPVVVLTLLDARRGGSPIVPAALVVVAALSDALDGYLARRTNEVTEFGRIVDPIADKALITGALAVLAVQDRVAVWVAVAIVGRELAVTALRSVAGRRGITVSVSRLGKNKTTLQVVAIVTLILAPDPYAWWVLALVYAALALTLVSGAEYFTGLSSRPAGESSSPQRSSSPGG